ncbi:Dps family protein [Deinococcus maricopensis]|uniref:Ferritin Dps family protein n=1 Tax=Deinococcus maricopensis (strain DSM 21211 / LMG 22137 / NRRL B-23946 / LB-34) TaxID=709986 RepID=E8UC16_DEIML|nr:Dps family protein [Deinococcus maricopensis]ADV68677.1 Ferritin Dps family protein [Deinococcus maricopensis DSM 21211]
MTKGRKKSETSTASKKPTKSRAAARDEQDTDVIAAGTTNDLAENESGTQTDAAHMQEAFSQLVDHNYLDENGFNQVAETLQRNIATTISLYLKLKKFHWDIRGRFFRELHIAYDEFIAEIFPSIDEQAERLVMLGGSPVASPAEIARYSAVEVPSETIRDARTQLQQLLADFTRVARSYRDDSQTVDEAGDPATADMYNGILHVMDKTRWMIQAMLDDGRLD